MVLIVDSNEFRREKSSRYLRYDGIPSLSIGYDDFEYYQFLEQGTPYPLNLRRKMHIPKMLGHSP